MRHKVPSIVPEEQSYEVTEPMVSSFMERKKSPSRFVSHNKSEQSSPLEKTSPKPKEQILENPESEEETAKHSEKERLPSERGITTRREETNSREEEWMEEGDEPILEVQIEKSFEYASLEQGAPPEKGS